MLEILVKNRRFIVTGLLVIFSLVFSEIFPKSDNFSPVLQGFIVASVFFLVIPVLYSKMVLKESLEEIGWQTGNMQAGVFFGIVSVVLAVAIIILLAFIFPDFRAQYVFPAAVERSFVWFALYELTLTVFVALLYEVFFRGFVQLFWLREFGMWAIAVQTALFLGLIFMGQSVSWQVVPLIIFCPLSGFIAYRSESIWYSLAASWLFFLLTDVFFLAFR